MVEHGHESPLAGVSCSLVVADTSGQSGQTSPARCFAASRCATTRSTSAGGGVRCGANDSASCSRPVTWHRRRATARTRRARSTGRSTDHPSSTARRAADGAWASSDTGSSTAGARPRDVGRSTCLRCRCPLHADLRSKWRTTKARTPISRPTRAACGVSASSRGSLMPSPPPRARHGAPGRGRAPRPTRTR